MRALLLTSLLFVSSGCTAANFDVAPGGADAIADGEIHDSALEDGSTLEDSSTLEDGTLEDSSTATDSVVSKDSVVPPTDAVPLDAVVPSDSVTTIEAGTPDVVMVTDATPAGCLSNASCGTSMFCYMVGCGVPGTCAPPIDAAEYAPKCGCDGVTYWNPFQAAQFGVAVHYDGPCKGGDRETCTGGCSKFSSAECVFALASKETCPGALGSCWRMPSGKFCAAGKSGPNVTTCAGTCTTACEAVRDKLHFTAEECTVP